MLLIIENKDDPTDPIAEETDGGTELLYIPIITAPVENDMVQLGMKCTLDRMGYEFRSCCNKSSLPHAEKLIPLFLHELGHTGTRPKYLSAPIETTLFGAKPEQEHIGFFTQG